MMTSNRPLEDWGKLIGDVPSATAILDRFLHHAEVLAFSGKSYRLRNQAAGTVTVVDTAKPANAPTGSDAAGAPKAGRPKRQNPTVESAAACQS
jgi:hypothetical protein